MGPAGPGKGCPHRSASLARELQHVPVPDRVLSAAMFGSTLRRLLHRPAHTLTVVLTLGIGIALVATQYALMHGVLLRPLPFPDGERIMHIAREDDSRPGWWRVLGHDEFVVLREQQTAFDQLAAFRSETYNLVGGEGLPLRLWGSAVSADFFPLLGVRPLFGRLLGAGDEGRGQPLRAVIGWRLWQDRFGADPAVLGRSVRLNGESAEIVGVLPDDFRFPGREQVWVNLRLPREPGDGEMPGVEVAGRLPVGVEPATAASELEGLLQARRSALGLPADTQRPVRVASFPVAYNGGNTVPILYSMLAMTTFVLLLACINVGNLQAVKAAGRGGEFAVRGALGASRLRLLRLLLADTLALGLAGLGLGLVLAGIGTGLLQEVATRTLELPGWMRFELDPAVIAVAALATLASALAAGAAPLWLVWRQDPNRLLRADGRGQLGGRGGALGRWFVAGQLAFACATLLVAALLAWNTMLSARAAQAYAPDSLLVGRIELQGPAYADAAARGRFYEQLMARLTATPGVVAAAVSSRDLVDAGVYGSVEIGGQTYPRDRDKPGAYLEVVSRDYFRVVGADMLRGRVFGDADLPGGPLVAVVNARFAERHWPDQDPLGQRIRREGDERWATVIGVVADLGLEGIGNPGPGAGYYLMQEQMAWGWMELLVRTEGAPAALAEAVRRAVAEVDPEQPVHSIVGLQGRSDRRTAGMRLVAVMAGVFGGVAMFLAVLGVYGVVAHHARRSLREIGLRMALGASRSGIVGLMLRRYVPAAVLGIVAGSALGQVLLAGLAGVMPHGAGHWPLHVGILGALTLSALLASLVPALRAAAAGPLAALRAD